MASYLIDYITTCAMLLERGLIVRSEKAALTPREWREKTVAPESGTVSSPGPWEAWHVEAWRVVKERLRNLPSPIDGEADIGAEGIDQLTQPVLEYVVYLAYRAAGKRETAENWHRDYEKSLAAVSSRLILSGTSESQQPINQGVQFRRC